MQMREFVASVNPAERLRSSDYFLDEESPLRVSGRLRQSTLAPESKHLIILSPHQQVVKL
ncbi:hypothetical protein T01_14963 [Trichinella spiralis]|uniref:Uncharacterized protein n=1 Tax=Trichinella spiralis TaxID=6334 RepID=A0A0V1B902_TRISP|nr:hypothetical protein T01_14963 [Trichinella spiralis]